MLIAQITDLHVRPKGAVVHHMVPTAPYLRRALEAIDALQPRPDLVLATGDLTDRGKPKEYKRLRKLLAHASVPVFVLPGNHDDRAALRAAFADHAYLPAHGPLQWCVDAGPLRVIGLDTVRKKHPGGELDAERLSWLAERLEEAPTRPTLLAMHHPPFAIGVAPVDAHGFRGVEALAELIAAHPQVARIVCGHVHRAVTVAFAGSAASTAPSTAPQLVLDRAGVLYGLRLEAPGFALHRWTGSRVVTEVRYLGGRSAEERIQLRA
ncbi:MAG TPA: phosphodiesterase [Candidatus Sulfotelmatobacter sp.]|nr:phosphodiesterase [Candidatus Sulfotelmatobacter sp.]